MGSARPPGLKLSKEEVSQTINFDEVFGVDLSRNESLKQAIGQAIIDRIVERTESGKSVNGGNLKSPYSESYVNSKKFKIYGKSKNDINMTLTGQTLNSIDIEDSTGNAVKISVAESKAPQSYNQNVGDTQPKRAWFGVSKSELNEIKRDFKSEIESVKEQKEESEQNKIDLATLRALGGAELTTEKRFFDLVSSLFDFGES